MNTTPSKALRNTLLALGAAVTTACPGVPLRPVPQTCSPAAIQAMDKLKLPIGDRYEISISDEEHPSDDSFMLRAGPIVSLIRGHPELDYEFPDETRLFGEVLPSPGDEVFIRYTELQVPGSERVPICAVADAAWKEPGNPERFEVQSNRAFLHFVRKFAE